MIRLDTIPATELGLSWPVFRSGMATVSTLPAGVSWIYSLEVTAVPAAFVLQHFQERPQARVPQGAVQP